MNLACKFGLYSYVQKSSPPLVLVPCLKQNRIKQSDALSTSHIPAVSLSWQRVICNIKDCFYSQQKGNCKKSKHTYTHTHTHKPKSPELIMGNSYLSMLWQVILHYIRLLYFYSKEHVKLYNVKLY